MQKNQPISSVTDILANSPLKRFVERANQLALLNEEIQKFLPAEYSRLYRIANLVDNRLVIEVQNAAVRQGLLWQQATLLAGMQGVLPNLTELEIRLNPNFNRF